MSIIIYYTLIHYFVLIRLILCKNDLLLLRICLRYNGIELMYIYIYTGMYWID